jgi:hypothetical protein
MHLLLSLVHDQYLIDETFYLIIRFILIFLRFKLGYVVGRRGVGFRGKVVHALHDLKLLFAQGVKGASEAQN